MLNVWIHLVSNKTTPPGTIYNNNNNKSIVVNQPTRIPIQCDKTNNPSKVNIDDLKKRVIQEFPQWYNEEVKNGLYFEMGIGMILRDGINTISRISSPLGANNNYTFGVTSVPTSPKSPKLTIPSYLNNNFNTHNNNNNNNITVNNLNTNNYINTNNLIIFEPDELIYDILLKHFGGLNLQTSANPFIVFVNLPMNLIFNNSGNTMANNLHSYNNNTINNDDSDNNSNDDHHGNKNNDGNTDNNNDNNSNNNTRLLPPINDIRDKSNNIQGQHHLFQKNDKYNTSDSNKKNSIENGFFLIPKAFKGDPKLTLLKTKKQSYVKKPQTRNNSEGINSIDNNTNNVATTTGNNATSLNNLKNPIFPLINVLIVEDNIINQSILSSVLRKHKIRHKLAKNGKEAVEIWKKGGIHLIFMDLQLPVLSGIDAAKQIRLYEKLNGIGSITPTTASSSTSIAKNILDATATTTVPISNYKLDKSKFRAPVIIVALTASNSQSDKQRALVAGCNDYLTKPVNLVWLSNKLGEWGCMQALIDFDGWKFGQRRVNSDNIVFDANLVT